MVMLSGRFRRSLVDGTFFARRQNIIRVLLAEKNVRLYWLSARQRRLRR